MSCSKELTTPITKKHMSLRYHYVSPMHEHINNYCIETEGLLIVDKEFYYIEQFKK
jgi:hypothetical protein